MRVAGRLLLDTNAMVALREGHPALEDIVSGAQTVWLSLTTVGELLYGARNSARPEVNLARQEALIADRYVVMPDLDTAREYARVKVALRRKGRPIPDNDLWIAATALQHNLVLVTRDAHFDNIDGLSVQAW
jgi:tRNA(fMet)-specific endonuclease VapC